MVQIGSKFFSSQLNTSNIGKTGNLGSPDTMERAGDVGNTNTVRASAIGTFKNVDPADSTTINEKLEKMIKAMGLRATSCPGIYCEQHNPYMPDGDYSKQRHYYWDEQKQELILIPNLYGVGSDGQEAKSFLDSLNNGTSGTTKVSLIKYNGGNYDVVTNEYDSAGNLISELKESYNKNGIFSSSIKYEYKNGVLSKEVFYNANAGGDIDASRTFNSTQTTYYDENGKKTMRTQEHKFNDNGSVYDIVTRTYDDNGKEKTIAYMRNECGDQDDTTAEATISFEYFVDEEPIENSFPWTENNIGRARFTVDYSCRVEDLNDAVVKNTPEDSKLKQQAAKMNGVDDPNRVKILNVRCVPCIYKIDADGMCAVNLVFIFDYSIEEEE